jgi:hypothetical protein
MGTDKLRYLDTGESTALILILELNWIEMALAMGSLSTGSNYPCTMETEHEEAAHHCEVGAAVLFLK